MRTALASLIGPALLAVALVFTSGQAASAPEKERPLPRVECLDPPRFWPGTHIPAPQHIPTCPD